MSMQYKKVHPLDSQDVMHTMEHESSQFMDIAEYEGDKKALKQLKSVEYHDKEIQTISSIKGFKDMMIEAHSKTPVSVDAFYKDFRARKNMVSGNFSEDFLLTRNHLKCVCSSNFDLISQTELLLIHISSYSGKCGWQKNLYTNHNN